MPQPCVITIGNFDGVHCGHRAIVARALQLAKQLNVSVKAITFDPHPASILRPEATPSRLTSADDKQRFLREAGAGDVQVLAPTPSLLSLTAEEFVQRMADEHHPVAMVEGTDFRFGAGREGDVATLTTLGETHNFAVEIVESIEVALSDHQIAPVRSSFIRWLIQHGRMADAAICLGRPYTLTSVVEQGEQRGRTIGVPTANLAADSLAEFTIPKHGVYAGVAKLADGQTFAAAISIGTKPSFAGDTQVIEAHLLNFAGDLYGQPITLHLSRWLRDQSPFPSLAALKSQLARDIEAVRTLGTTSQLLEPIRGSACPQPMR